MRLPWLSRDEVANTGQVLEGLRKAPSSTFTTLSHYIVSPLESPWRHVEYETVII
jgi:hypothetical protein